MQAPRRVLRTAQALQHLVSALAVSQIQSRHWADCLHPYQAVTDREDVALRHHVTRIRIRDAVDLRKISVDVICRAVNGDLQDPVTGRALMIIAGDLVRVAVREVHREGVGRPESANSAERADSRRAVSDTIT